MAYQQQQTLICSAKAEVRQNQPSRSVVDTAAPSVRANCSGNENNSPKETLLMSYSNLSASFVSAFFSVNNIVSTAGVGFGSTKSVKEVAPSCRMDKISKASRKAQHRLAAATRRVRQSKNNWLCSPAFQLLCREADHSSRVSRTTPPSGERKAGASSKSVIKRSLLSDGQGQLKTAPAVRVHKTFVNQPVKTAADRAAMVYSRPTPKTKTPDVAVEKPLLAEPAKKLGNALKEQRKQKARVKSLSHFLAPKSPELAKAKRKLELAEQKAARLSEAVKTNANKKKEQREAVEAYDSVVPNDDFYTRMLFLKQQLEGNLAPSEFSSKKKEQSIEDFAAAAAQIVAGHKVEGADGMTMLMSLSTKKDAGGNKVDVLTVEGTWSGKQIDPLLKTATKKVMVNLVGKNNLQKTEFTKRGFVLVAGEWYCLHLADSKQLIKDETPVRPPIVSRAVLNPPKLVVRERADGSKYLHLFFNVATPKNIKELLAEPKELEVLVNISPEQLEVADRDKFVEFLRANGFENYSTHTDWLVLPAGKKFAEPKVENSNMNKRLVKATLEEAKLLKTDLWSCLKAAYAELNLDRVVVLQYSPNREIVLSRKENASDYKYLLSYQEGNEDPTGWLSLFNYCSCQSDREDNAAITLSNNDEDLNLGIAHMEVEEKLLQQMFKSQGLDIKVAEIDWNRVLVDPCYSDLISRPLPIITAKVVACLTPWSFESYSGQEEGLQLNITVDAQNIEAVLTISDDEADSYAQAEKLGVQGSLKTEVVRTLEGASKDVHYVYDTRTSLVLYNLLNSLGFVNYSDTADGWLVKRVTKLPEVVKPITTEEVKPVYITVHSSKTKAGAVGSFTVGDITIPVEVDQAATEPANRLLCVKQAIAYAVNARAKAVSIEYTFGQYDLNSLAKWKAAGWKVSNVDLLKAIDELASSVQVTWINSTKKETEVRTVETRTVEQTEATEVQTPSQPVVNQREVRTVQQRTVATKAIDTTVVEQNQEPAVRTIQERVKTNPDFEAKPRMTDSPFDLKALLELLPQSEVGKLGATPDGISPVFTFKQEERTGLSEVIVAAFSMKLNLATGEFDLCNINTPSRGYTAQYTHYGTDDVLEAKKASMNVMSGAAPTSDGLPYSKTPFVCNISKHCVDGARGKYIATAHSSVAREDANANIQIVLCQPGGESALTKENSIPGVEGEAREELRTAVLAGDSKTIYSALYKDDKDEVGTETSVTVDFTGVGLETILADGRRHTFVIVAWYDKEKHNYFTKGGKQFRIYPHTASVFHVDDLTLLLGGDSIFKFDVRELLGLAAAPTVEAGTATEVKFEREKLAAKTPIKPAAEPVTTEVQDSIARTNLAKELADLYKHTRLKGLPLSKGLTQDEVKRLRKNIGGDGLIAFRTLSYIKSRTENKPVQLFDWTKADVLKVAELFFGLMPTDKATADEQVFCYREDKEGLLLSFDGGTIEFLIGNDGRAYNAHDNRAFEQGMELIGQNVLDMSWWDSPEYAKAKAALTAAGKEEPKKDVSSFHLINGKVETREVYKPEITDVCFSSSIGKFMQAFCAYLLMFAQSKNNTRRGLGDNFKILLNKCDSVISMTEGDILGQNGGFLYSVQNSPKLYVQREQHDIHALPDDKVAELAGSVAAVVKGYAVKTPKEMLSTSSTDTQSLAMKVAFEKYPALGFHFAKGTFINGLTHLRLATLQMYAPTLFNKTLQLTGLNVKDAVDSVVSLTLKASKGAKRATLALARAVEVLGEVKAGWAFYGQEKVLTGWLVQECMAPTFVMAPGMSFFLGNEDEKPVALVRKTQTEKYPKFLASKLEEAVSMTGVNEYHRCLAGHKPIQSYDEASATHRITFEDKVTLLKGTEIAFVKKEVGQGSHATITFNSNEKAILNDITWRVHNGLGKDEKVLVVSYSYTLHHRNPKLRGVIKTMMGSCNKELLYNWFNNQKLAALGLNDIKLVAPQDTIKSDMLYSWLMVVGNTIRHNDPANPHIAQLIKLRDQLNQEMMGGADYDRDTIVINPAAVVAGLYSKLLSYFNQHFGLSLWMHVQQPGDQGEIMNRLYVDRVAQNAGWIDVPEAAWGDYEKAWAVSRSEQGYTVKLYAESVDYLNNDKQNALLFTLNADGVVVEYLHRSFCFVGAEGAPVYGVELFESSTVAEAISDSRHMTPSVRSLSRMEGVAFDDAWKLLNAGKEKIFMSLVIAGMSSNDKFNCSKTVTILERGDKKDKNLVLSAEDKLFLNSILAENNINLDYYEDEQFKSVAHAFRDIVFVAKGKTYWLPALFAINKLKSESSSNNLAQQFFREILVECLAGRTVPAIEGSRAAGILDSLCDSASTKKLITAATNVTGKRISLPHIPAGEIHILKSTHPASEYQNLVRNGFKLKDVEDGKSSIFTHNSRAPLTDGSLLKLVIVTLEQNEKNFWKLDSDSFALGGMGNGMDFGDFDGDGHYFVQLVGTDYKVSTFDSVAAFISDAVGYNIFNTYANPSNAKGDANKAYLADHYNIKKWSKVDETLCNMNLKKAKTSSATYLEYNQKAREMQAKATGIAYSVYMWSEHLVDILLAYRKLGGVLPLGFDAAADGSLVAPISQVYEVILGGFSDPAWAVYTKYFLKLKEGDRTVFDHNLAEFNKDLMAMGITGQKQAGFSALMFASYHLFFLERWGAFNDYEADCVTKNPLPLELKGMLSCALVSFELMRGKFQGFTGALEVKKGGKVTGHKTAMNFARGFLLNNPGMVSESLVCKQLAQTIEVCNHLLEGKPRAERSPGTPGVIQERTVAVPTSNLSDEALQHFLTKVGALVEVKVDESGDEGGSKVEAEPNTPDSGDGGVAVEAIDYATYLESEEVAAPTVEELVCAGSRVVEEYYSESELEEIAVEEELEFAVSTAVATTPQEETLQESLQKVLSRQSIEMLEALVANLEIDVDEFVIDDNRLGCDALTLEEYVLMLSANIADNAEFHASEETIVDFVTEKLDSYGTPQEELYPLFEETKESALTIIESEEPQEVTVQWDQPYLVEIIYNSDGTFRMFINEEQVQVVDYETIYCYFLDQDGSVGVFHDYSVEDSDPEYTKLALEVRMHEWVEVDGVDPASIKFYRGIAVVDRSYIHERPIDFSAFNEPIEVLAEQVEQPVESKVIENGTNKKMALMQVVEQLPESALDKLLAEGERLLAELTKTKEPVREVKVAEAEKSVKDILRADYKEELTARLGGVYQVKEVEAVAKTVTDEPPSIDRPKGGTKKQSLVVPSSKKAAKPEVTNSSSREILQPVEVVQKAHPLDGLAPLSASTAKPMIKDIAMAAVATQFIGTSAVSKPSSTELYRQAWADWKGGCANTGVYTAEDVIMVSGNGSYRATEAQITETFSKSYVPFLMLVVNAKAAVVVGDCSGTDSMVKDYLLKAGYKKDWVAAAVGGYNKLTPPSKLERTVVVEQLVEAAAIQPEGDWIEALVSKLEPWTANQIKKALATLSSEQLEAARIIIQHAQGNTTAKVAELDPKDVVGGHILTGKAGTGKSYTAGVIIQVLDLLGFRVVACGTTGLASQNLKNSSGTINRVLSLGTGFEERKDARGNLLPRTEGDISQIIAKMVKDGKVAKRLSEQSDNKNYTGVVLLVDEAFMLGGDLGVAAAEGLKTIIEVEAQKGKVRQRPVQLLMVGDPKQLEPVKDRMIFEEGEFLEYSDSTEIQKYHAFTDRLNLKVIKLEKNERQSGDSAFGLELDLLGEGKAKTDLSNCPVLLSRFKASLSEQPAEALHIIFNNDEVAKFNKSKLDELVSKGALRRKFEASMDYSRCGKGELLGYVTPTPETLELVVGAPVRVTQNIPKNDGTDTLLVANGERGIVTHMAKDKVTVKFKDGRFEELEAAESRKIPLDENGAPIGSFKQLPLCLCWATTFHGSQGQTYPKGEPVIVHMYSRKGGKHNGDVQRVWSNNAFYVACSRVTRAEDLFFYTGLGVDEKEEGVTEEEFTKQRMNTYFNHFKASYRFNKKAIAWLDKQSC